MTVIEGNDFEISTSVDSTPAARVLVDAWREVSQAQRDALYGITFGDLVARIKQDSENMFYI
jgi:DNA-binding IscR family transcriptional regulator